ncbi:MAG: hypothetical protein JW862_16060 [Anaerolineales bacterium]|nr:hypothetical protein [Anaerolineales bacterium]
MLRFLFDNPRARMVINSQILVSFHGMLAALYLVCLAGSLRRRGLHDRVARLLASYLGLSLLWEIIQVFGISQGRFGLPPATYTLLLSSFLFLLTFLLYRLGLAFLRFEQRAWPAWLLGGSLLALILAFGLGWLPPLDQARVGITTRQLATGLVWIGWGLAVLLVLIASWRARRSLQRMSNRNRVAYWLLALLIIFVGELLYLLQPSVNVQLQVPGEAIRMTGVVFLSVVLLARRLPDLRDVFRRLVSGLSVALVELTLYTLGFVGLQALFRDVTGYNPLFTGLAMALVLLILLNPLLRLIERGVTRRFFRGGRDHNLILREYSQSISNILDLKLLATVSVGLVNEALEIQQGALYTVDLEVNEKNQRQYRLKGFQGLGGENPVPLLLSFESPIAQALGQQRRPLTQAEIDMQPQFRHMTNQVRSWLNHNAVDVFVPIHAKEDWVGVFALGSKRSGSSYFDGDLELLATLADQTAVALQNSRLVESLVRVNSEFRRAYTAMEEAHRKLERIDRTKSDFISIASHELRTPLTVLSGYSQMLVDDPTFAENAYYSKIVSGIYDGTTRLHEIVDSMLDVAKIDTRALDLQAESVHLPALLKLVCQGLGKALRERSLELEYIDMDTLPAVQGDSEGLRKVFYQLVVNAIKYTPDGGKITVSGRPLPPGNEFFPDGGVEIVVSDTGIGIDPRFKELIFTKFYQTGELALHSSGKTKFKGGGPGLGLAIVRGIIQAHGGRVWAESPGYDETQPPGSHFHVILPLKLRQMPSKPADLEAEMGARWRV